MAVNPAEDPSVLDAVSPDEGLAPMDWADGYESESDEDEDEVVGENVTDEVLNADPDELPVVAELDSDEDEDDEFAPVVEDDLVVEDLDDVPPPPPPPEDGPPAADIGPEAPVEDDSADGDHDEDRRDGVAQGLIDGVNPDAPDDENPPSNDVSLEANPQEITEPDAPTIAAAPDTVPVIDDSGVADVVAPAVDEEIPPPPPALVDASGPSAFPVVPVVPPPAPVVSGTPEITPPEAVVGDDFVADVFEAYSGMSPDAHHAMGEAALADLTAHADGKKSGLVASASPLLTGVDAAVGALVAQIQGEIGTAETTIRTGFSTARSGVESAAAVALGQIDTAAGTAKSTIDAKLAARLGEIGTIYDGAGNSLTQAASAATNSFSAAFAAKVAEIRALGDARAAEANSIAATKANAYKAGADSSLEGRRKTARAEAAVKVGLDYAAGLKDNANKMADEIAKGSRNIPSIVSQIQAPVVQGFKDQRAAAKRSLEGVATSAKTTLERQRTEARTQVEKSKTDAVTALTRQEETSVTDLQALGRTAEANLNDSGAGLKATLSQSVDDINKECDVAVAWIKGEFAAGQLGNGPDVQQAVAEFKAQFDSIYAERLALVEAAQSSGIAKITQEAGAAKSGIGAKAQEVAGKAGELGTELGAALTESARLAGASFGQLATNTDTALAQGVASARQGVAEGLTAARTMFATAQSDTVAQLDTVKNTANGKLGEALTKINGDIESEAQKAADKIQPWYKKAIAAVVAVVVTILVVVAVAAFCVVTLGSGLIVAGIVAGAVGALVGALAGDAVLSLITWSNQFKTAGEYLVITLMGGIMGGIGAWAGPLITPLATWGKFLAAGGISLFGSLAKQGLDMLFLGEKWDWKEFFIGTLLGTITGGLAAQFSSTIGSKFSGAILGAEEGQWNNFQRAANAIGLSTDDAVQQKAILDVFAGQLGESPTGLGGQVVSAMGEDIAGGQIDSQESRDAYKPKPKRVEVDTSGIIP